MGRAAWGWISRWTSVPEASYHHTRYLPDSSVSKYLSYTLPTTTVADTVPVPSNSSQSCAVKVFRALVMGPSAAGSPSMSSSP